LPCAAVGRPCRPANSCASATVSPAHKPFAARLAASGDLDVNAGIGDIFDSYVEAAVRRFQARHGLSVDGLVREQTLNALNVTADLRLNQLKVNVVRLRNLSGNLGPRFVVCNIPAAQIAAIENGVAVSRHAGVVGKPDRPSPEIDSKITEINFNPFWTVPSSIVRRDLIPLMQEQPDYLAKTGYVFSTRTELSCSRNRSTGIRNKR
jgi:L,D-transpeptidase YcbB